MTRRRRLRTRILMSFLLAGLILGPLVAIALAFVSDEFLEWSAHRSIQERLNAAAVRPQAFSFQTPTAAGGARVLTSAPIHRVPKALFEFPDGIHEHETGNSGWLAAVKTTSEGRIIVVDDMTEREQQERYTWVYAVVGAVVATLVALLAGLQVSARLTAPLERLAWQVRHAGEDALPASFSSNLPEDEVRTLAEALDRYRERIRAAIQRERRFSGDVSHELRNPLAVIRSAAEIIESDEGLSARSARALQRLDQAALRMQETVTTLLELIREGDPRDHGQHIVVSERLDAILEQEFKTGTGDGLAVEREDYGAPVVVAPQMVVDVICGNLVRNALQHARPTRLQICLYPDRLVVADDGVGMAPQIIEALNRDSDSASIVSTGGSTGLGLSLVQRLCERFGWSLSIDSEPSVGTRVSWHFTPQSTSSDINAGAQA